MAIVDDEFAEPHKPAEKRFACLGIALKKEHLLQAPSHNLRITTGESM
jgi:hypothetical protein